MRDPIVISTSPRQHRLHRPGQVEAGNQLEPLDRRHQVAFVQPARLVVDEDDAAADHHHHEDRHHDRSGQQVLDVRYVGIQLDDIKACRGEGALFLRLLVEAGHQSPDRRRHRRRDEVVRVVLDDREPGLPRTEDALRIIRRDGQHAIDAAGAKGVERRAFVAVRHGVERLRVGGDGTGQLSHPHRRHAAVLIDDRDRQVPHVAAEGVAEHDQLHQWKDQRHDDQQRAAAETAQLAFDDRPGAMHQCCSFRMMKRRGAGSCSASRRSRPV
jgi:hypothetical protein